MFDNKVEQANQAQNCVIFENFNSLKLEKDQTILTKNRSKKTKLKNQDVLFSSIFSQKLF